MSFDLKTYLKEKRVLVDRALETVFPASAGPAAELVESMKYSLFAGGKRLRPILCIAGAETVGGEAEQVMACACALELVHTYSLIHDDLPVMDDDDLRRGKPTNHKVFGDAVALLAGDGLLTEAFRIMAPDPLPRDTDPRSLLRAIGIVSEAAGYRGMVGGQVVDIRSEGSRDIGPSIVEYIHAHKTGDLITAAVTAGAVMGGGNKGQIESLRIYGRKTGLAFQIADDILNVEGDSRLLGKGVGSDAEKGKATYPAVYGLARSKEIQKDVIDQAVSALRPFDHRAEPLRHLARYIIERKR